jgi:hypothetical protein
MDVGGSLQGNLIQMHHIFIMARKGQPQLQTNYGDICEKSYTSLRDYLALESKFDKI